VHGIKLPANIVMSRREAIRTAGRLDCFTAFAMTGWNMAVIADGDKRIFVIARHEAIHKSCRPDCFTAFAMTGRDMAVIADGDKRIFVMTL
jgi:precorrin-3B methylase